MTAPTPPNESDAHTDYLRRSAEAAEATRRHSRILAIVVAVPVAAATVVATAVVGFQSGTTYASTLLAAKEHTATQAVEATARAVGYTPPAYTTIANQIRGICENLDRGKTTGEAAAAMAVGFGEGMRLDQAVAIVETAKREAC